MNQESEANVLFTVAITDGGLGMPLWQFLVLALLFLGPSIACILWDKFRKKG